jgi:hypothetical protein
MFVPQTGKPFTSCMNAQTGIGKDCNDLPAPTRMVDVTNVDTPVGHGQGGELRDGFYELVSGFNHRTADGTYLGWGVDEVAEVLRVEDGRLFVHSRYRLEGTDEWINQGMNEQLDADARTGRFTATVTCPWEVPYSLVDSYTATPEGFMVYGSERHNSASYRRIGD